MNALEDTRPTKTSPAGQWNRGVSSGELLSESLKSIKDSYVIIDGLMRNRLRAHVQSLIDLFVIKIYCPLVITPLNRRGNNVSNATPATAEPYEWIVLTDHNPAN